MAPLSPSGREIGFQYRLEQEEQDPEPRDSPEHFNLIRVGWKQTRMQGWRDTPEYGRSEKNPDKDLCRDRRLPHAPEHLAQRPCAPQEQCDLGKQQQYVLFSQQMHITSLASGHRVGVPAISGQTVV